MPGEWRIRLHSWQGPWSLDLLLSSQAPQEGQCRRMEAADLPEAAWAACGRPASATTRWPPGRLWVRFLWFWSMPPTHLCTQSGDSAEGQLEGRDHCQLPLESGPCSHHIPDTCHVPNSCRVRPTRMLGHSLCLCLDLTRKAALHIANPKNTRRHILGM